MKKLNFFLTQKRNMGALHHAALVFMLIISVTRTYAQPPDGFNYQAVLRDASGNVRANTNVSIEISILKGSTTGNSVFNETQYVNTNSMGLITLEIGSVNTNDLKNIDWSDGPYFIKIEVDGIQLGTSKLLSVPYALYAKTVETDKVDDADADPYNEIQTMNLSGTQLSLSNGGGTVTLPSSGGGDNWGTQTVVSDASLSGDGTSGSPLKIAQRSAITGQVLKWNGSNWTPGDIKLNLPYIGWLSSGDNAFRIGNNNGNGIEASGSSEDAETPIYGIYGVACTKGVGVIGEALGPYGTGVNGSGPDLGVYGWGSTGVEGYSPKDNGTGIKGVAAATSSINYGVFALTRSPEGYGIYGKAPVYGVYGNSTDNKGRAVMGEASGINSIGVYAKALEENSTGVWGEGANYDFYANGPGTNYGSPSSIRWKKNMVPIDQPLEKVNAIRGIYFDWDEEHGGQHDVGMIAEEVGKVLPEIVVYEKNGVDASGMDYSKITPLLLEAIKAQQEEIGQLMEEINKLKEKIKNMGDR